MTTVSTDTFTITRTQEGTSARTIVVGDQIAATVTKKTIVDVEGGNLGLFDYVVSGCVWSGDAYASTKAASMTAGTIWLNNVQLSVAAVTARTFTASKDTYVDFSDAGDGTATINYTEATNNAASSALTAGRLRNAIIVTGASNIAAAGSVNQGQETMVLPIASSIAYSVSDSLGNLICNRDITMKLLGLRRTTSTNSVTSGTFADLANPLSCPVIIPAGRKVKVWASALAHSNGGSVGTGSAGGIYDTTSSVMVKESQFSAPGTNYQVPCDYGKIYTPPASGARTFKLQGYSASGAYNMNAQAESPAELRIELE